MISNEEQMRIDEEENTKLINAEHDIKCEVDAALEKFKVTEHDYCDAWYWVVEHEGKEFLLELKEKW